MEPAEVLRLREEHKIRSDERKAAKARLVKQTEVKAAGFDEIAHNLEAFAGIGATDTQLVDYCRKAIARVQGAVEAVP